MENFSYVSWYETDTRIKQSSDATVVWNLHTFLFNARLHGSLLIFEGHSSKVAYFERQTYTREYSLEFFTDTISSITNIVPINTSLINRIQLSCNCIYYIIHTIACYHIYFDVHQMYTNCNYVWLCFFWEGNEDVDNFICVASLCYVFMRILKTYDYD